MEFNDTFYKSLSCVIPPLQPSKLLKQNIRTFANLDGVLHNSNPSAVPTLKPLTLLKEKLYFAWISI
jgi:hypothetical protein